MFAKTTLSIFLTLALALFISQSSAQTLTDSLPPFKKIVVSPLVNLVLSQGEREHIRIEYEGIGAEKINYAVKGNTLRIYLDDARYTVKTEEIDKGDYIQSVPIYKGVQLTAYVTYRHLKNLQVRGEETIICQDSLVSRKFKIKLFGESKVDLAYVQSRRFKVHAFGENKLTIHGGDAGMQTYRLFGENKIDVESMPSGRVRASSFGESELALYATEEIRLWGFGEVEMMYDGDPYFRDFVVGTLSTTLR